MTPKQFKDNFRVERSTCLMLLQQMGPHLRKDDTNFRLAVPVEKRLCCALYALGSSSELRTIANLFGNRKSTAGQILREFCELFVELFFYRISKFPNSPREIEETIGSLDGSHISVKPSTGYESD